MNLHLAEIATQVAPGAIAALLLDQAGWHMSSKLVVPANIVIVPLPPKCPELNPTENVWQFMRDNWLSNRVFKSYTDIVDHCCDAWNKFMDQPSGVRCMRIAGSDAMKFSSASRGMRVFPPRATALRSPFAKSS